MVFARDDQLHQHGGGDADPVGFGRDLLDRPVGVGAVVLRHVIGLRGVAPACPFAPVGGDPLALEEDFYSARRDTDVDLSPQIPVGDRVVVAADVDMIIKADTRDLPFGVNIKAPSATVSAPASRRSRTAPPASS